MVRPQRRNVSVSASAVLVDTPAKKSTGRTLREVETKKAEVKTVKSKQVSPGTVDGKQILELLKTIKNSRGK